MTTEEEKAELNESMAALENISREDAVIHENPEAKINAPNKPLAETDELRATDDEPSTVDSAPAPASPVSQTHPTSGRIIDRLARSSRKSISRRGYEEVDETMHEHLDKHVKEVRANVLPREPAPTREGFMSVEPVTGRVRTDWIEYIKASIRHFVNTAASDKIDSLDAEAFSLAKLRSNIERIYNVTEPLQRFARSLRRVYRWENKLETALCFVVYYFLWYHDLFAPILLLSLILLILSYHIRPLEALDPLVEDALSIEPSFATIEEKRRIRRRYPPPEERSKGLTDWWEDMRKTWGPFLQMELGDVADTLEKVKNLATWKRPRKTRAVLLGLVLGIVALYIVSIRHSIRAILFFVGIQFFVLLPLQSHFPRYRRLFSVIEWVLWDVPTDAEWAMEVMQRKEGIDVQASGIQSSGVPEQSSIKTAANATTGILAAASGMAQDIVGIGAPAPGTGDAGVGAGMGTGTGVGAGAEAGGAGGAGGSGGETGQYLTTQKQITDSDGAPIPLSLNTEVGSAATVGKRSSSFDSERSSSNSTQSAGEVMNEYRCTYRGLPGKLVITSTSLQFKLIKFMGGKTELDLPLDDIVGVKKSKGFNILFWYTNSLEITTLGGKTYIFEHVNQRDDCFNRLITISGKKWHRV